ncbi:hypothetical protein KEM56_001961 [Ascosphaera pollenicola]|nr:hypothetical protein KEM56_001961 [Ascosphaera pollenicola]
MKDTPVDFTEPTLQKANGSPLAAASASVAANTPARNLPSSVIASPARLLESSPAANLSTTQPRSTSARKSHNSQPVRSLFRPSITPRSYTTRSRVAKLNRGYSSSEDDDDEQSSVQDSAVKGISPQRESSVASSQGQGESRESATPSSERPAQQPNPPLSSVPQVLPDSPETKPASNTPAAADTTEISARQHSEEAIPPVPLDTTKDESASDTPVAADTTEASARQQSGELSQSMSKAKLSRSQRRLLARAQAEAQPGLASSVTHEHPVDYREHTPSTTSKPEQSSRPQKQVAASPASSPTRETHAAAAEIAEANEQPPAEVSEHQQDETIGNATSGTIDLPSQPAPSTADVQYPTLSDSGEQSQGQVQSTEDSQIAGAYQSPIAGQEEQTASVHHESSLHVQTPTPLPEAQQPAAENVTDEAEATGTPESANASDAAVSSPEIPDAPTISASRVPNNTDAMQQVMDRLLETDIGPIQSNGETSDEEAELDINPHYRMMLSTDNMKTQSLPADGIAWGPEYRVHGSGREFVLYQRKGGDNYDEVVDEEGNDLGDINNPPWVDLTYAGARQYEVYRRLGIKGSEGARYHRNHMVNSTSRYAWVQQYVDRLNIPAELMEQLASFTEEDFWEDYTPYLMNHHSLIPLFDRYPNPDDYELPGYQGPLGDIREFLGANPVTMDVAARAMRSFICLAIGSLQRFPHDYKRAAQFFNVARSARDILFMCEPSLIAQAMVLSVQYFIMLMQYDEAWVMLGSAIRICEKERWNQYTGTRYLPRELREERRRVWWACVLLERHLALQTGLRPVSSFKSDTPWPSRQTYTVADDYRDPPWDLMTAYPDPLDVMEEDDGRLKAASVTSDFTDSFFFKLYLEQASFIDPIMEIEHDLRSDGDITTALEKLAAFDLNKLAKLEADMAAYKRKVPNHYDALSTFDKNLMPNDACVTQALILTWWWHYLRLRLCRPFYAIALADAIHDKRPANSERPKPHTRLEGNPSGLHHSIVEHYTSQCLETTNALLEVGRDITVDPYEDKITPVLPRHVLLPVLYEAAKMAILSNCVDRPEKMTQESNEDVDYTIMLLLEYYAPPPVGQLCGADLDEMRKEVDKLVRDDGTKVFKFPSPALMESSPYDLKESRTLP